MKRALIAICTLCFPFFAMASGGMIGGGDTSYKPILKCESESIDHTHPGSPYVWVVKEVDYDGNFLPDATLRVVTLDKRKRPYRTYVTHVSEPMRSPDQVLRLDLWRYGMGTLNNYKTGLFQWDARSGLGRLSVSVEGDVEELFLTNCAE